jgi:hypothetical protein
MSSLPLVNGPKPTTPISHETWKEDENVKDMREEVCEK